LENELKTRLVLKTILLQHVANSLLLFYTIYGFACQPDTGE